MDYSDYPNFVFDFKAHFKIVGYGKIAIAYCFIFQRNQRNIIQDRRKL